MKRLKIFLGLGVAAIGFSASLYAADDCNRDFMKDPCAKEGYSVVQSERHVRPPHVCMACAHYFPGEEPEGYCGGGSKGKRAVRAQSSVAAVR